MTYGYDEEEYDEDWGDCRICGEYIYLYDNNHFEEAIGTPYRCAGEIQDLPPHKREQARKQHQAWLDAVERYLN